MRINIPPVTRGLVLLTISFTFLYALARWSVISAATGSATPTPADLSIPYLTLVPSKSIYYIWTVLTSTFVEQNVLNLLINTTAVLLSGRYLERAWGSKDFGIVVLIAAIIPNLLVIPTYVVWGFFLRNTTRADTPIAGAITLQAAFLVAFKQLVPEHTVSFYRVVKIRVKHCPAIFLLLNTVSGIVLGTDTALLLAWYGLITTWIYLRFFKYQPVLGPSTGGLRLRGDASETFAFATFFPNVLQPPIAAVCDQIYIFFCNVKIITPFTDEAIASSNEQAAVRGEGGLPTLMNQNRAARPMGKREEAERRRALALKALDERLNAASSQASVPATDTSLQNQKQDASTTVG